MAKKMDAEAISEAVYQLEEAAKISTLKDICDDLAGWIKGENCDADGLAELPLISPGLQAAIEFIRANYICE